jgi:hypothetical protein
MPTTGTASDLRKQSCWLNKIYFFNKIFLCFYHLWRMNIFSFTGNVIDLHFVLGKWKETGKRLPVEAPLLDRN